MSSGKVQKYLRERVAGRLMGVIPSRWRAVLTQLATRTQSLQKEETWLCCTTSSAEAVQRDFELVNALLEEEHEIYQEGLQFLGDGDCRGNRNEVEEVPAAALRRFLQSLLTCIAAKEVAMGPWKHCILSIPPDTLRVYCHMCIAHPHVQESDVERICLSYSSSS
ncbi:unnamed protein product [Trypanosoma congolense IL3000]|uniref:WGS project CAEQ00000000 data, annotated contig 1161 n=1 Tax=Trypanosoma congolense (strain IL3000) TaxID=1068625 RepID=F9W498_TRYCI|nr:unnamed protein product [Trypanosoma congolense IL3000]